MKRFAFLGTQFSTAKTLICDCGNRRCPRSLPRPSFDADKKSDAREQFERAVKMRTMLEGYLEKDRSLSDYKQTVAAYHKVYLISAQAEEVTPSLVAEAELYQEMGRLFDPMYFQSAVDAYNFLLKQYPGSRYRGAALLRHRADSERRSEQAGRCGSDLQRVFEAFPALGKG